MYIYITNSRMLSILINPTQLCLGYLENSYKQSFD